MLKRIFSEISTFLGCLLISLIASAFLYFLISAALIIIGFPILDLCCSDDFAETVVDWWEFYVPFFCYVICASIVLVDEKITPIFFRSQRLLAQKEDTSSRHRTP
jgi:hypothetical protein